MPPVLSIEAAFTPRRTGLGVTRAKVGQNPVRYVLQTPLTALQAPSLEQVLKRSHVQSWGRRRFRLKVQGAQARGIRNTGPTTFGAAMLLAAATVFMVMPAPPPGPGPDTRAINAELPKFVPLPAARAAVPARVASVFRAGYDLDAVRSGARNVPRLFAASLPAGLEGMSVDQRKRAFITVVLPVILLHNERVLADRKRLLELAAAAPGGPERAAARTWLAGLAASYRTGPSVNRLLSRVDLVPPSLTLAQAAEESGWGTSRFAVLGNALFGQWTHTSGAGLVPLERTPGATHEIKAFETLGDSVSSHARNLNSHRAYAGMRQLRAKMRQSGGPIEGYALAGTLESYSRRGPAYVDSLQRIILANGLTELDGVRLDQRMAALPAPGASASASAP